MLDNMQHMIALLRQLYRQHWMAQVEGELLALPRWSSHLGVRNARGRAVD